MAIDDVKSGSTLDNLKHMARALRGRNYALFFFGQGLSLIGTWMQSVALGLLVWKITKDPFWLGVVGFSSQIFGFVLTPLAGVFSDRLNRHRVLLATQALSMIQAGMLAYLTFSGTIEIWQILSLAAFLGLINAMDIPTRQAFVVQMVARREDLPNAIALNSFIFNGARLLGPVLAGVMIPLVGAHSDFRFAGEATCFAFNSVSYLAVLAALLAMKLPPYTPAVNPRRVFHSLGEGARYAFGFGPIRSLLLMLGVMSLMAMPYTTLLPAVAGKVLHHHWGPGEAESILVNVFGWNFSLAYENTYGLMVAAAGAGALLGALFLASRRSVLGLSRMIVLAATLMGLGLIGFALSTNVLLSLPLLVVVGFGFMVQMASSNTILQTIVDDDKRGRVMSFYTMSFMGTAPFGALLAGWFSTLVNQRYANLLNHHFTGEQVAIILSGGVAVMAAILFATRLPKFRRMVRPLYVKMGILSESALISKAAAEEDIEPPL